MAEQRQAGRALTKWRVSAKEAFKSERARKWKMLQRMGRVFRTRHLIMRRMFLCAAIGGLRGINGGLALRAAVRLCAII